MDFEKFFQLFAQITGAISVKACVIANIISFFAVIVFHKTINYFYAILDGMNNPIINVATWGFLISVYIIVYKAVSLAFKKWDSHKNALKAKQDKYQQLELLKQTILNLSRDEIGVLKFLHTQDSKTAWLLDESLPVIQLETKNIIHNIDITRSKIVLGQLCSAYTISVDAQNIISQLPQELRKKWRKIKPDYSCIDFQ